MPSEKKNVVTVDPSLIMQRVLHYRERHHGWHIFKRMYWALYLVVISLFLLYYYSIQFTLNTFLGVSMLLFAVMLIIYGLAEALHHKLMKRYG
ncbi:MAG: hypothetical protein KGI00_01490 [Candidatus Micrarchaeota archaeon]|nr:hypothetical protein [Candidatus Micrarchaeota archaeon]MDE1849382.1 hypothetical protein [Candidatus Micrarchaeota archaeon]